MTEEEDVDSEEEEERQASENENNKCGLRKEPTSSDKENVKVVDPLHQGYRKVV